MNRHSLTFPFFGALIFMGSLAVAGAAATSDRKPNIILVMADDLGYAGLGCYGQKLILTPRIDRMAAEGIRFTDYYAGNTVCVPSRVSLITGMHPGHASIRDNFTPPLENFAGFMADWPEELWPPKTVTLGQVLKRAGYKTAQFGKLEAGIPMRPGKMADHGWDEWFGFRDTGEAFQYYPLELWHNEQKINYEANQSADVRRPGVVGTKGVYSEDLFLDSILKFIRENKDQSFFLYFPTQVPHGRSPKDGDEMQVPDLGPYADRDWTHLEKLYAAAITRLDGDVGRIIDLLKELGIDGKTVVVLTSDNGDENSYYNYTQRFHATGPLRGKKRFLYEGGIRVPMIARWPGTIQPAQTSNVPCAGWDFMATFADLAGAAKPAATDGISLVPAMVGDAAKLEHREYLYWEHHMGKQQAVRMGKWKGVRFGGTKEPVELYDLDADPGETHNLADSQPEILSRIKAIMVEARADSEFNKFWPLPEYRQNQITPDKAIFDQLLHGIK